MTPITVKEPCKAGGEGLGLLLGTQSALWNTIAGLEIPLCPNFLNPISPPGW